ncbi:MAG: hypothetical protein ABI565_05855, partial [Vicinamibacteria bacterium]
STSDLLMENCDEFIFYEDLVRRQEKPAVVIPNIPEKLQEAFSILVDSVVALQLENKGALWGSMVKETMKRKKPSFNETYYGFRSFSSLLEDAQRRGVVTLRRDQKSGSYIVEDLGAAARGDGSIATPRPAEIESTTATPSSPPSLSSGDQGSGGSTNGSSGASSNGSRGEGRGDREPRQERRPAPAAPAVAVAPPLVATSAVTPQVPAPPPGAVTTVAGGEEPVIGTEADAPDGEAPSRPRRRRGGRGRGRGREGSERESRPDLEARGEDVPLPLDEDSNPSIPTPPQAAAAYAEVVDRMAKADAPVFWDTPSFAAPALKAPEATSLPPIALPPPPPERRTDQVAHPAQTIDLAARPVEVAVPVARPHAPKPTPPVAPVDPAKASFSLLGWLKGGG